MKRVYRHVLNGSIVASGLFLAAAPYNTWITYYFDYDLAERVVTLLIVLAILLAVSPRRPPAFRKTLTRTRLIHGIVVAGVGILLFAPFAEESVTTLSRVEHRSREAFQGKEDWPIIRQYFENNLHRPPPSYLEHVRSTVPENESILFLSGGGRGHIPSFYLYPRPLYMLPRNQNLANDFVEFSYLLPDHAPLSGEFEALPEGRSNEALRRETEDLIAQYDIQWIAIFDPVHPERSGVYPTSP